MDFNEAELRMREEIFDHVRSLRRYALVLTRDNDEAEDLVQETLTKALAGAGLFSPDRDLRVWQDGMALAELCYRPTKSFPRDELFAMTSQIRRSAVK